MTVLEYDYEESENFLLKCLNLSLVIARKMVLTVAQKIRWKKIYFHLYLVLYCKIKKILQDKWPQKVSGRKMQFINVTNVSEILPIAEHGLLVLSRVVNGCGITNTRVRFKCTIRSYTLIDFY